MGGVPRGNANSARCCGRQGTSAQAAKTERATHTPTHPHTPALLEKDGAGGEVRDADQAPLAPDL